jgi:hypothetical protein
MRRRAAVLVVCLLAGCDAVFGLSRDDEPPSDARSCEVGATNNEDKDGFADPCDPCPADPDPDVKDKDSDGVGDQCDPTPDDSDYTVVAFDGFNGEDTWAPKSGTWVQLNGENAQQVASGTAVTEWDVPAARLPAIDVRFSNPPCPVSQCGPAAFIVLGTRRVGCGYDYQSGQDQVAILVDGAIVQTDVPAPEGTPDRLVIRVLPGNMTQCRTYSGGKMTAEMVTQNSPWAETAVTMGLMTRGGGTATFHSVTVLSTPSSR